MTYHEGRWGMRSAGSFGLAAAVLLSLLVTPASADTPPVINSLLPTSGPVGALVTIKGNHFTGATEVTLKYVSASFTIVADEKITMTVPDGASTGRIRVTTPAGTATSADNFRVTTAGAPPVINSFSPTSGPVGRVVAIFGNNFTGAPKVTFKENLPAIFVVLSDGKIWATVPQGTQTGRIRVTTPGGTATSDTNFRVIPPPNITSFSPTSGMVGTSVTILGEYFSNIREVRFGALMAPFTLVSGGQIVATIPQGTSTGLVSVTTPGGMATSTNTFVLIHPRKVTLRRPRPLVAEGVVKARDQYSQCRVHVPVRVERRVDGRWKWVARGSTRSDGSYRIKLRKKIGKYRARVKRWTLSSGDVCARATSGKPSSVPEGPLPPPGPPPETGTNWGVFAFPRDGLTAEEQIQLLEAQVGRNFSAQRVYTNMNGRLPTKTDVLVASRGWLLYHNINSFHPMNGEKVCYQWSDIATGRYDSMLIDRANEVREWGYPVIMSFTHEPNVDNPNHPLCGTASEYQAAFDHVVRIFDQQDATNVTWAWVLTAANFNGADGGPAVWEPQHYEIVGVDGYNHASTWRSPRDIFQAAADFAQSRGKPLMIGEVGCEERSGDPSAKANWITGAAALFKSWRDVNVVFWTHTGNGGEWWLDTSPQELAAFAAAGQDPYFI